MIANQTFSRQIIDVDWVTASASAAAETAATLNTAGRSAATPAGEVPLVLLDPATQEPFKHRQYRLHLTGKTIEGTTDQYGATRPLSAEERASFIRWHVDDADAVA